MDTNIQPKDWFTEATKRRYNFWEQLAILIGLIIGGFIVTAIIQVAIGITMVDLKNLSNLNKDYLMQVIAKPENFVKVLLMQLLSTLVLMAVPAVLFVKIIKQQPIKYFGLNNRISTLQIVLVVVIALCGLGLSGGLGELNKLIPLSKGLKATFESWEKDYEQQVMIFANMKTVTDYILSIFMVAILPAIFEELLFRGVLQKILIDWFKKPHIAIIVTAIIFSAVHGSFFGLLPRMMLGMVLGYIYFYGKNLWLNILMHFINNGVAITAMYFATRAGKNAQETINETFPLWVGAVALVVMIALLSIYKKICEKPNNELVNN